MSNPLPDIFLIDGGKLQLNAALCVTSKFLETAPLILSIVKGSKRVRSTETILSNNGIIEMSKDSPGYVLLQQIRDESHRFAITANRKKKNKSTQFSALDKIKGLGKVKKRNILNHFKSLKNIKAATREDLCQVSGISIKIAEEI